MKNFKNVKIIVTINLDYTDTINESWQEFESENPEEIKEFLMDWIKEDIQEKIENNEIESKNITIELA